MDPLAGSEPETVCTTVNVANSAANATVSSLFQNSATLPLRTLGAAAVRWPPVQPPVQPSYMDAGMHWSTHGLPRSCIFGLGGYPNPFACAATGGPPTAGTSGLVLALTTGVDPAEPAPRPANVDPAGAATASGTNSAASQTPAINPE